MRAQQIWITMQIHVFLKKHTSDIIYIIIFHGHTFPRNLFLTGKYPNIYRCNPIYNGIGVGNNTYIWPSLMVCRQDREHFKNPDQCQSFGIPICYDPTNQHIPMGIEAYFNNHIPMLMVGSKFGFITRYPKDEEIDTC